MRLGVRVTAIVVLALVALPVLMTLSAPAVAQEGQDVQDAQDAQDNGDHDGAIDPDGDDGPAELFGTLRSDGEVVESAELTITDTDGNEVGTAVTDDGGQWVIEVEGGDYVVTLTSLPEGVELRDPAQDSQEVTVPDGDRRTASFQLGDPPETRGAFSSVMQQLVSGLRFGLIIAMMAVGLSLIFGTTGLINFAHGDLVILGTFLAWVLNVSVGLHLLIAAPLAIVLSGVVGALIDRGMFRPLRRRGVGLFQLLVVTIGFSLVLRYGLLVIFGGSRRQYDDFVGQQAISLGPISQTPRNLWIMAIALVVLVAVGLLLMKSRMGKAMRAVADNRDLAESSGIDVEKVTGRVWIYGTALAGLGGILYGAMYSFQYVSGFQLLLLMFAAVILGGLGTAFGAMFGGIIIGVVVEVSSVFFPSDLGFAWALGILILVLLFRPQGLFGRAERIG